MPGQLLRLRLLGSPSKLLISHGGVSVLKKAFPFKLKYYSGLSAGQPGLSWGKVSGDGRSRAFSSFSVGRRSSDRRGSLRTGSAEAKGKSLVEDEAELSDWMNDLKPDSFRAGKASDSDDGRDLAGSRSSRRDDWGSYGGSSNGRGGSERVRSNARARTRDGRGMGRDSSSSWRGSSGGGSDRVRSNARGTTRDERGMGRDSPPSWRSSTGGSDRVRSNPRGTTRDERGMGMDSLPSRRSSGGAPARGRDGRPKNFNFELERGLGRGSESRPLRKTVAADRDSDEEEDDDEDDMDFGIGRARGMRSSSSLKKRGSTDSSASRLRSGGRIKMPEISEDETADVLDEEEEDFLPIRDDDRSERTGRQDDDKGLSYSQYRENSPPKSSGTLCADSYLTDSRFDQCSISPLSLKGVKASGYERMTVVQAATLPLILKGKDVLAKAKTGTGKTVAFLLPSIEVVSNLPPADRDQRRQPISVLVVCPTRELANQAAMEADKLLKFHTSIGVQVVTGGTRLALEQKRMQANPCQILVATPGRLRDHIENTPGFATRLMGVKVLVLDEADHLLDMGFRKDIERIVAAVPKQRQTLLFSATVPDEVRQICHIALKRDHEFINTVEEGEETHSQVSQLLLVAPLDKQFSTIYGLLTDHIADNVDYKVLVFCTTAMVTKLIADVLAELNLNVREMHSRKPQSYRTRVSDEFRKSKGLILVTSDVSARGVDYPDVSLVIQVGVPSDREQYIHRLGRTGRKGKQGEGILLLSPWEEFFTSSIKDLPVSKASPPLIDPETRKKVERALAHVEMKNKEAAYQSWLGYYNSNKVIGRDKARLVSLANEFSRSMGLDNPPALSKIVLGKMGLRNVPGLRSK